MAISLPAAVTGPALDVVAWLVTYALHSTVLLLAALIAFAALTWMARRSDAVADAAPALRECLGKVALLAGVATASIQLGLGIEPFGLRPSLTESRAVPVEVALTSPPAPAAPAPVVDTAVGPALPARVSAALPTVPIYFLPVTAVLESALRAVSAPPAMESVTARAAPSETPTASTAGGAAAPFPIWIAAFLVLWAFVTATALVRRVVGCHALALSLAGRESIRTGRVREIFDGLCARAGLSGVELSVAPGLAAPITRGILRREVCLSPRALSDLSHDELAALLGHEVAHAARRDPAWLAVFRSIEIVLCLQPLNRVVARRLEDDAELLCDDRAVVWTGDRLPLASCLTEVASWLVPAGRTPRLAVGMATHGARLTRRVERLVDEQHEPDAGRRRPIPTLCAAGVAAAVVVLVPGFAAERAERPLPLALRLELAAVGANSGEGELTGGRTAASDANAESDVASQPGIDPLAGIVEQAEIAQQSEIAQQADGTLQQGGAAYLEFLWQFDASAAPQASAPADFPIVVGVTPDGFKPAPLAYADRITTVAPHVPNTVRLAATPLRATLDALEAELDSLRAELAVREGVAQLALRLDELSQRAQRLRVREQELVLLLAIPSNTLLSPDEPNRAAEVR